MRRHAKSFNPTSFPQIAHSIAVWTSLSLRFFRHPKIEFLSWLLLANMKTPVRHRLSHPSAFDAFLILAMPPALAAFGSPGPLISAEEM